MTDARFEVEIEGVGRFSNVESWSINQSYLTATDAFEFTVYAEDDDPEKLRDTFRPLQPVRLYINDRMQLAGRIDATEAAGDDDFSLRVTGRDYFAAFIDAHIDPSFRIQKGETLEGLVLRLLQPFGVTSVSGDGFAMLRNAASGKSSQGTPADFRAIELEAEKPSEGVGVFQFLTDILTRHGFTLQPTKQRWGVALVQPEFTQGASYRFTRSLRNPEQTNIKSGRAQRDYTDVPSVIVARSRAVSTGTKAQPTRSQVPAVGDGSPSEIGSIEEVQRITGSVMVQSLYRGGPVDPRMVYRPMFYADERARNQAQLDRGIRRELAGRLRQTLEYRCELDGVAYDDGTIYTVDTIAEVDDDVQAVHERLWVLERTVGNNGSGEQTTLSLIRPGSFVL